MSITYKYRYKKQKLNMSLCFFKVVKSVYSATRRPVCWNEPSGQTLVNLGKDAMDPVVSMGVQTAGPSTGAPPFFTPKSQLKFLRTFFFARRTTLRVFLRTRRLALRRFFAALRVFLRTRRETLRTFLRTRRDTLRRFFFTRRLPLRDLRRAPPNFWLSVLNRGVVGSTPPGQVVYAF